MQPDGDLVLDPASQKTIINANFFDIKETILKDYKKIK